MGLSSSGPAQTLAVSLAGLVAVSGYSGVVPILICFVPMMGIAIAYQRLNRWDQSSGATYTWVAKVFHPYLGFLSGWMILLYYTLGTTTLTIPAGVYTLDLLAPAFVDDHWAIFLVGAGWNLLITALAIVGLKVVARFEWVIVVFQYTVLLIVAAVALAALLRGTTAVGFSWAWFSWTGLGGMKGLMGGILIACFMYSGWDASIYVNEETTDRANNPGKAALASVVMLALVYSVVTFAFQSVLSPGEIQAHAGDVLSAVSARLMHKPWDSVMALVVLTGTLATLQAAVVSAARVGLAMSRDRVMPKFFQRLSAGSASPWAATLTMSAINLLLLALALGTSTIAAALTNAAGLPRRRLGQRGPRGFLASTARLVAENSRRQHPGRTLESCRRSAARTARRTPRQHRCRGFRVRIVRDGGTRRERGLDQFRLERGGHRRERGTASRPGCPISADAACERCVVRPRNGSVGDRYGLSLAE